MKDQSASVGKWHIQTEHVESFVLPLLSYWGPTSPRQTSAPIIYKIEAGSCTFPPQEGLLTYFAPQPSWTTHFGRREKKQGGKERGEKEPYRALLLPAHPRSPQHKSSWHRRALSQYRESNHNSVSSQETGSRVTLLILPYSSSVALSNFASPTPHPWLLSLMYCTPVYPLTFMSSRTKEMGQDTVSAFSPLPIILTAYKQRRQHRQLFYILRENCFPGSWLKASQ